MPNTEEQHDPRKNGEMTKIISVARHTPRIKEHTKNIFSV